MSEITADSPSAAALDAEAELRRRLESQLARQSTRQTDTAPSSGRASGGGRGTQTGRRATARWQRWMRWLHTYASMVAFVIILFFGVTGLVLNHPGWFGGDEVTTSRYEGALPASVRVDSGHVEFLAVSQHVRSEHGVAGEVTNFDQLGNEGSINYTGPGYGASVRFDVVTLEYEVTVREEGLVNAMRDLHTGSDSGSAWRWTIDVAAGFLVFVAMTGLAIQVLMRKRRISALTWLAIGVVVTVALIWISMA